MLQLERVSWHPEAAIAAVARAAREAEHEAGMILLAAANARVPFRSGFLEESGVVAREEDGVVVSYSAPYAPILRVHPEWQFRNARSGRWLDEAIETETDTIAGVIEDTIRAGWPG